MTTKIYPDGWTFAKVNALEEIKPGDRFPVVSTGEGKCENCGDVDGLMMSYLVTRLSSTVHGFDDSQGGSSLINTSLQVQPCPVCNLSERARWLELRCGLLGLELEGKDAMGLRIANMQARPGQGDALNIAKALLQEIPHIKTWALFYGSYGSGKTHLLAALVNACRVANIWAVYTTGEKILSRLKRCFEGRSTQTVDEIRNEYESAIVLVIDELNHIKWTEWAGETLFAIIENRHMQGLATWFGSNKPPSKLKEQAEPLGAIVSRISAGWLVSVTADDQRVDAWQKQTD